MTYGDERVVVRRPASLDWHRREGSTQPIEDVTGSDDLLQAMAP